MENQETSFRRERKKVIYVKLCFGKSKRFWCLKKIFFFLLNIIYCNYFTFSLKSFKFSRTRHISFKFLFLFLGLNSIFYYRKDDVTCWKHLMKKKLRHKTGEKQGTFFLLKSIFHSSIFFFTFSSRHLERRKVLSGSGLDLQTDWWTST
jgi:hypothetical protein